jgi:hypothetical protein
MTQISHQLFQQAKVYLSDSQDKLVSDVEIILKRLNGDHINDYSFVVSPIAKAYEGYLKDFFLKIGIISNFDYESDRFRVGKTLNPSLRYKRFSVFQRLADFHEKGEELAEILWDAWKYGRNEIFHYFPNSLKNLNRQDAEERIVLLLNAIIKSGQFLEQNKSIKDQEYLYYSQYNQ